METKEKTSVLIIDDSTQKITMLEAILSKLDINLISVTSGTDGLRKLLVQEFACILLDVNMPVMDGFETAKMIRQRPQSQKTPIIFVTAVNSAEIDMRKGYNIGAVDYILTPLVPEVLIAKVVVFVELFEKNVSLQKQTEELLEKSLKLSEQANQLKQMNEELEARVKERTDKLAERENQYKFLCSQFEAILDHIPGLVFYKDTKNNFVRVNKYLAEAHHTTKEELENKSLFELYPKEVAQKYFEDDLDVISDGKPKLYFDEPWEKGNESRWVNTSKIPFEDSEGKIIGIIGISLDVTERKLAEEKLIQSEERYKRITEGLTDYLYTVIVKDGKAIETIHSEACKAVTGYTPKEFLEDPNLWINMVVPEEKEFVAERASKLLEGKEQPPIEHRIVCKNGKTRWVMDTTIPKFDADDRLVSYEGVIQDITTRKQAEFLLQAKNEEIEVQNEKLNLSNTELIIAKEHAEESDRLKSAFLANMSHEIRTPMNGILGFTELLKEPDLTGENQQSYISIIEKSGERMLNIINDIISFSKIESGQMGVSISETNINEQIEYIHTFFKPEVEQKGLQISYRNTLPAKEAIIKTDREKIYAILTNLVKNAIKFTKTGSIKFGYEKNDNHLQFSVTDTGIGIRPEQLKIVFERFRQGSESLNRSYEGAGLGLSISKAYVEMLGGKIWVESEEGKGSSFYFTLPYDTQAEDKIDNKNVVLADVEIKSVNQLKILIAEDNEESEILLSLAVEKFSKNILKARTGIEAVETCRNNTDIDLVLMDVKMPEMDGYEATRHIRQFNKNLVIVAQTAFALTGDREKAIAAGCNDYISKPIRKDKLMEVIHKHF
ncbi:MAG: response regulator [Bacteroidota bacterium]|nr:response regulator [Bacteroidota bacterium]